MSELNLRFVVAAYGVTWLCLALFAWATPRRLARARTAHEQATRTGERT
jgi:hypothetical protein